MSDLIRPLKIENPAEGGSQTDFLPTEANPQQDYVSAKGFVFEDNAAHAVDTDVTGNIQFKDTTQTTPVSVTDLKTASKNTFDNSTNGFISTNVQAAIEEAATMGGSSTNNFSYNYINSYVAIPVGQQMLTYQELEIGPSGELEPFGELVLLE